MMLDEWNGPELRELRQRLDITQEQLAAELHISPETLSRWERGDFAREIWSQDGYLYPTGQLARKLRTLRSRSESINKHNHYHYGVNTRHNSIWIDAGDTETRAEIASRLSNLGYTITPARCTGYAMNIVRRLQPKSEDDRLAIMKAIIDAVDGRPQPQPTTPNHTERTSTNDHRSTTDTLPQPAKRQPRPAGRRQRRRNA